MMLILLLLVPQILEIALSLTDDPVQSRAERGYDKEVSKVPLFLTSYQHLEERGHQQRD